MYVFPPKNLSSGSSTFCSLFSQKREQPNAGASTCPSSLAAGHRTFHGSTSSLLPMTRITPDIIIILTTDRQSIQRFHIIRRSVVPHLFQGYWAAASRDRRTNVRRRRRDGRRRTTPSQWRCIAGTCSRSVPTADALNSASR